MKFAICVRILGLLVPVFLTMSMWAADERVEAALCSSELAKIRVDYPTARMSSCRVVSANRFELFNEPEDTPINPSPWFGFLVERQNQDNDTRIVVTLKYANGHKHRYTPKYSTNRRNWRPIDSSNLELEENGSLHVEIPKGNRATFVSAQEILDAPEYDRWIRTLRKGWPTLDTGVIGYSHDKRPIQILKTNPAARKFVLIIGRQHPPEVTGGKALMHFVNRLAALRSEGCIDLESRECQFFRSHSLIIVPLVNPDGVAHGYWRHNVGSTDLNRDWGPFLQPETQAVRDFVNELVDQGRQPSLMLDFHSTNRNVLYVQTEIDKTQPLRFAYRWYDNALSVGLAEPVELASRELTEKAISKNYFFRRFGIPAITYEVADTADPRAIAHNARVFADQMVVIMSEDSHPEIPHMPPRCSTLYCFMSEANIASLVMLNKQGLINRELAHRIAIGIDQVAEQVKASDSNPPANYLNLEGKLVDIVGVEAANVHIGRSRQDLHGVSRRLMVRFQLLRLIESAIDVRSQLLSRAQEDMADVIPAYTHGVPSQPTTFGHQCLAFSNAIARDIQRYIQIYERMNESQLGVAAGNTSGYELDRQLLARLLGFEKPVINAYDANFLSTADYKMDVAAAVAISAVTITQFVENIHSQQRNPRPWICLNESMTSGSSIMPQKQNPRPLDRLRTLATEVIGTAQTQLLLAHNVDTGMHDYRKIEVVVALADNAVDMYQRYLQILETVVIDSERAIEEINRGYSTSTEVADTLFREGSVPFRKAHEYVSNLVELARSKDQSLLELTTQEWKGTYRRLFSSDLPIGVKRLRSVLEPAEFVANRRGLGGPQTNEIRRDGRAQLVDLELQKLFLRGVQTLLDQRRFELYSFFDAMRQNGN